MKKKNLLLLEILTFWLMSCGIANAGQGGLKPDNDDDKQLSTTWLFECGMRNGFAYEHAIGKNWVMRYGLGEVVRWNFQPIGQFGPVYFIGQYHGIVPYLNVATRWYSRPSIQNNGFFLGFDILYTQDTLKIARPKKNSSYNFAWSFLLSPNLGYNLILTDQLNMKMALYPTFGVAQEIGNDMGMGMLTLTFDFGISYRF